MTRARTDISVIAQEVITDLGQLREHVLAANDSKLADAFATIETHIAISLRLMAKTNPSKLHDIARTVEIATLIAPGFSRQKAEDHQ